MSKSKKVIIYQKDVPDNESWRAECANKSGLLIVELYSDFFGHCQVLEPSISDLMKAFSGEEQECIRWRRVNVLRLEKELQQIREEESKKNTKTAEEDAGTPEEPKKDSEASDLLRLPNLEQFPGFNHPQPFFLFMRNGGEILDILRECNPPLLEEMVTKYMKEDATKNPKLTFEVVLKTEEELRLEKEARERKKAHMNKIHTAIELADCEDPMSVTAEESKAILKLFLDPETQQPYGRPDENYEEYYAEYKGKSVDHFGDMFFDHVTDEQLELILNPPEPTPPPLELTPSAICEKVVNSCDVEESFTPEAVCALIGKILNEDMGPAAEDNAHVVAVGQIEDQTKASICSYVLSTLWGSGEVRFANVETMLGEDDSKLARSTLMTSVVSAVALPFTEETAAALVGTLATEAGEPVGTDHELVTAILEIADDATKVSALLLEKIEDLQLNALYVNGYIPEPPATEPEAQPENPEPAAE